MSEETIPEVSVPTTRCPHPEKWHCWEAMSTEQEVCDMLTALVWMLKPEVIVETGCYDGHGTEALVRGAHKNGSGQVYTCDIDHCRTVNTLKRIQDAGLLQNGYFVISQVSGVELISSLPAPIDFAFLDSGGTPSVRGDELRTVVPKLSPWGVVAIHDTGETHPDMREEIEKVANELNLDRVFFDTPRGFCILKRKV